MVIRPAGPADAEALVAIERAADAIFAEYVDTTGWPPPTAGEERLADGQVLVVEGHDGAVVGFAHARPHGSVWHLEQLSVHPDSHGKGIGGDLLDAIESHAREVGALAMSLRTYRDVPWNAPWYRRRGYEVMDPPPSSMDDIVAAEAAAGLLDGPARVAMLRQLVTPVTPRVAVSVVPLRDGPGGLEVFVQHRAATMDFAAGAVVFPGGRVDAVDREAKGDAAAHQEAAAAWAGTSVADGDDLAALRAAAVRELEEETGVRVDPDRLLPWDNWVTPAASPKRFDAFFFVLPVQADDLVNTTTEAVKAGWEPVDEVIRAWQAGELMLMTPTRVILAEVGRLGTVAEVAAAEPVIGPGRRDGDTVRPRR